MVAEKKKTPLRSTPTRKRDRALDALDQFAAAAGKTTTTNEETYPWEAPYVREDVMKNLPLRLSEPLYLKLKYIASRTPYSMNSFILERLTEEIEDEIAKLTDRE
jgi:hypothetical protein